MTDAATAHRPATRPGGAPSRPDLHVVPPPDDPFAPELQSETETAPEDTPSEGSPQVSDHAADTAEATDFSFTALFGRFWASSRDYWTAPAVFTDRPASLADLHAYATAAPWTHQRTGFIRGAGVAYYRYVAYPYTVVSRYREWFAQRPGRLLPALGGLKLISLTGPGDWAVHTLIYPVAQYAGHIFL